MDNPIKSFWRYLNSPETIEELKIIQQLQSGIPLDIRQSYQQDIGLNSAHNAYQNDNPIINKVFATEHFLNQIAGNPNRPTELIDPVPKNSSEPIA